MSVTDVDVRVSDGCIYISNIHPAFGEGEQVVIEPTGVARLELHTYNAHSGCVVVNRTGYNTAHEAINAWEALMAT